MAQPGSLRFVIQALERFTEKHVKIITLDARSNLTEDTPRDTGWARNNWVPSIGSPYEGGGGVTSPEPSDVAAARSAGDRGQALVLATYTLGRGKVFVSNNVPYITRLNNGSSTQAPSGFVQAAIARAVRGAFRAGDQIL